MFQGRGLTFFGVELSPDLPDDGHEGVIDVESGRRGRLKQLDALVVAQLLGL